MAARIQVPSNVRRGDIIEVRLLVQHAMESGYRYDDQGRPVPRNVITQLTCTYGGNEVFRAEMFAPGAQQLADLELDVSWRAQGLPVEAPGVRR